VNCRAFYAVGAGPCFNNSFLAFFEILAKKVSMNIAFVFDDFYEEKTNIKMDLKVMKKIVFSFSLFVLFFWKF